MPRVIKLVPPAYRDVVKGLRNIAEGIEAGAYGDVVEAAIVLNGKELVMFGLGKADSTATHYLFCAGASKMLEPALRKGEEC